MRKNEERTIGNKKTKRRKKVAIFRLADQMRRKGSVIEQGRTHVRRHRFHGSAHRDARRRIVPPFSRPCPRASPPFSPHPPAFPPTPPPPREVLQAARPPPRRLLVFSVSVPSAVGRGPRVQPRSSVDLRRLPILRARLLYTTPLRRLSFPQKLPAITLLFLPTLPPLPSNKRSTVLRRTCRIFSFSFLREIEAFTYIISSLTACSIEERSSTWEGKSARKSEGKGSVLARRRGEERGEGGLARSSWRNLSA